MRPAPIIRPALYASAIFSTQIALLMLLTAGMLLGRLEIMAVLGLFAPAFWRS